MTEYGYFLASEEHGPRELVEQARMAEQAGFTALWISDHYHPWIREQGQSPFVWSVVGALAEATALPVETAVTCPTVRIHPAVVAQAAATSAVMLGGRFRLGVGSGEALNEHILGGPWPSARQRLAMLEEAIGIIRALLTGQEVSHRGTYYTVRSARIHTLPEQPVRVDISGFGPAAIELAGRIGDGFVTMGPGKEAVARFRAHGGAGKPVVGGAKVCWSTDRDSAVRTAHRLWPTEVLPGELNQILPTTRHFEQAASLVTEKMVADAVVCGNDVDAHVARLRAYEDAGFDTVYVNQIGQEQRGFFDFYRDEVLPQLTG